MHPLSASDSLAHLDVSLEIPKLQTKLTVLICKSIQHFGSFALEPVPGALSLEPAGGSAPGPPNIILTDNLWIRPAFCLSFVSLPCLCFICDGQIEIS